jgi:hypothetical protein
MNIKNAIIILTMMISSMSWGQKVIDKIVAQVGDFVV